MNPLVGLASALLQYYLFATHPVLRIYPHILDAALGPGAFAALLLAANILLSTRHPYTSAFTTLTLYLSEVALSSPPLRLLLPLPELPQPDAWTGAAAVLLLIAASAKGLHGALLALAATPALPALYLSDWLPPLDPPVSIALAVAGLLLIAYALRTRDRYN
ncbi:MAG: hypothetical protein ABWK05_03235 [Pyrobaculum sp.]